MPFSFHPPRAFLSSFVREMVARKHILTFKMRQFPSPPPQLIEAQKPEPTVTVVEEEETDICCLCEETLGKPRICDGQVEHLHKLPCSHVFGSVCIARWLLDESPKQDCPFCRKVMVHPGCRHVVFPHDAASAPRCLKYDESLPDNCLRCRGEEILGGKIANQLDIKDKQERALRGLETHLPSFFSIPRYDSGDIQKRLETIRRERVEIQQKMWVDWLNEERRVRW